EKLRILDDHLAIAVDGAADVGDVGGYQRPAQGEGAVGVNPESTAMHGTGGVGETTADLDVVQFEMTAVVHVEHAVDGIGVDRRWVAGGIEDGDVPVDVEVAGGAGILVHAGLAQRVVAAGQGDLVIAD